MPFVEAFVCKVYVENTDGLPLIQESGGSWGEWICVPCLAVKTSLLIVHVAVRGIIKTRPSPLSIFCRLVPLYHLSFLSNKGPVMYYEEGVGHNMVRRRGK